MAGPLDNREGWAAEATLLATDTTKTLLPAPSGNRARIVVTHIVYHVLVAAAQAVDIKVGTVNVKRVAISEAVGNEGFLGPCNFGIRGQAGQPLTIVPAAAGPSLHVIAEGFYET